MKCCPRFSSSDTTPLPIGTIAMVAFIKAVLATDDTMVFSYLSKMLKSFGTTEVDVGYQVGLIGTVMCLSWVLSFFFWGYIGDMYGRKRALLITMCGAMVTGLAFGFSTSFYWALGTRFLFGFFMGMTCLLKSILMLACDHTNSRLAFSIYYSVWTLTLLYAPSLAGFLVFPVEQYPNVFGTSSIFQKFKVLLPNLIVTFLWISLIPIAYHLLANDQAERRKPEEHSPLIDQSTQSFDIAEQEIDLEDPGFYSENDYVMLDEDENSERLPEAGSKWKGIKEVLFSRDFLCCTILSTLVGSIGVFLEEMFPVFALTSKEYNGLALTLKQIGIIYLGAGGFLLLCQYLIVHRVLKCMGERNAMCIACLMLAVTVPLIPLIAGQSGANAIGISIVTLGFNFFLMNINYIAIQILINNCTPSHILGIIYSIAGTANLIGRTVGPLIYGPLYSWSLKNVKGVEGNENALGFPFNQCFDFLFVALTCLIVAIVTKFVISKDIDID